MMEEKTSNLYVSKINESSKMLFCKPEKNNSVSFLIHEIIQKEGKYESLTKSFNIEYETKYNSFF